MPSTSSFLAHLAPRPGSLADRALDATIALSFDRTGFDRHARGFDPADLDVDMTGKVCLVTGANSGIGRATARALATRGASVYLLCRSEERGRGAERELRAETGNPEVHLERVDLADLGSIRELARRLPDAPVDVLVHNAGVLPDRRELTADGIELTWATHVAGPFLLTHLLESRLRASRDARVVWVSSGGMYSEGLDLDDVDWARRSYDGVRAYAQTKRAQVVLAELWAGRLCGSSVSVHSMHPGWADTPAVRSSLPRFHRVTKRILRDADQGADTAIWLAAGPRTKQPSGRFWFDRQPRTTHLLPTTRESATQRRRLWERCERWTDASIAVTYGVPDPAPSTIRLRERIEVDRPIEEVFRYVADFSNTAEWDPGIRRATRAGDAELGTGSGFEIVASFLGQELPLCYHITRFEPPTRVVLEGQGATLDAVDDIRFEPNGGGTTIRYGADLTLKGALALSAPLMGPIFDRIGRNAIEGLERRLSEEGPLPEGGSTA